MEDQNNPNKSIIKKLFFDLFNKKGYSPEDYFDFSIWFMKNHVKGQHNYFETILSETPTENDDIIKFTLIKSFIRTRNKYFKIRVQDFTEEIVESILNLKNENLRVDGLIKTYDAFETKNIIEQNLLYYDKLMKNQDATKSRLITSIEDLDNIKQGAYKFSLCISYLDDREMKEQILNYRLNQIIKVEKDCVRFNRHVNDDKEFLFQETEFFSFELPKGVNKYESGTNILYFYVKMENLESNQELVTDKKPILDVFLSNIKSLLNNFKQVKSLQTKLNFNKVDRRKNSHDNEITESDCTSIALKMNVEFDPYTLSSIYHKITALLQDIISYKVLVEHKYKTIMSYFDEISSKIEDVLSQENKNDDLCIIY
jgi:hypothetical protein